MSIADFNLTYLTPLLEKLNKEDKLCFPCFLMSDFSINLRKMGSKCDNSQFYNTMCSCFFTTYSSTHKSNRKIEVPTRGNSDFMNKIEGRSNTEFP